MRGDGERQISEWRGRILAISALGTLTAGIAGTIANPSEARADEPSAVTIESNGTDAIPQESPVSKNKPDEHATKGHGTTKTFEVPVITGDTYQPVSSNAGKGPETTKSKNTPSAKSPEAQPSQPPTAVPSAIETAPTPQQPEQTKNYTPESSPQTPYPTSQPAPTTSKSKSDPQPSNPKQKKSQSSLPPVTPATIDASTVETWNPSTDKAPSTPPAQPTAPTPPSPNKQFQFPLIVTKEQLENRAPHWPAEETINKHHHYNAADIFTDPGTEVVAPVSGTITNVVDDGVSTFGSNVELLTDSPIAIPKDNPATPEATRLLFYITHMEDNSVSVKIGQHVNPGDHLGVVGGNDDANGTASHEHIDAEIYDPNDANGVSHRPNCDGVECQNNYPFINVQSLLHDAFQDLPQNNTPPPVPTPPTSSIAGGPLLPTITPVQFADPVYGGQGESAVVIAPVTASAGIDSLTTAWNPGKGTNETQPAPAPTEVAPATPESQNKTFDIQRAAFQAALAQQESNFHWDDTPNHDGCSGGYQYAKGTWANYAGYPEAYMAPPSIQFQSALEDVSYYYEKFNGDWRSVAMAWYAGPGFASKNIDVPIQEIDGQYPAISQYGEQVMAKMQQYLNNPQSIPEVPGVAPQLSNPAIN